MIHQRISPAAPRLLGRASLLVATALGFLLSGDPAAHADDGGLLHDPVPTIVETATQTVEPVVETPGSVPPTPEEQPAAPAVQQAVEPAVTAAHEAVEPAVKAAENAVGPGSKVSEGAVRDAAEPVVNAVEPAVEQAVEPAVEPVPAPAEPQVPTVRGPNSSHPVAVSQHDGPRHVDGGAKGEAAKDGRSNPADRTHLMDLAPRPTGRTWILDDRGASDDPGQAQDPGVWALTNALMHLIAGDPLPGSVNAGLPPGAVSVRAPWTAPLVLGLLGLLCLVLARRRLG